MSNPPTSCSTRTDEHSSPTSASPTRGRRHQADRHRHRPGHGRVRRPEQLQGRAVDARADQYALACTSFALLTGTNVYMGTSVAAIAVSHVRDPIRWPPTALRDGSPRSRHRAHPRAGKEPRRPLPRQPRFRRRPGRGRGHPAPAPGATAAKMAAQTLIPDEHTAAGHTTAGHATAGHTTARHSTAGPSARARASEGNHPGRIPGCPATPYPQSKLLSGQPKARPRTGSDDHQVQPDQSHRGSGTPTKRFASPYQAAQPTALVARTRGRPHPNHHSPGHPTGVGSSPTARRSAPAGTPGTPHAGVDNPPEPHRAQSLSGDLASRGPGRRRCHRRSNAAASAGGDH